MTSGATREDADEAIRNEARNAFDMLLRLLGKYGLTLADIPKIQQRHQEGAAVKAANAAAAAGPGEPNAFDLTRYMLEGYANMQSPHDYVATTLWFLHSYVFDRFMITPRLALLSPVPGCGKSMVLKLAERLTANPEKHDNITAAALFRLRKRSRPSRRWPSPRSARSTRPLIHRSVVIRMRRTSRTDLKTVELMDMAEEIQRFDAVRRRIVTWAQGAKFRPDPPLPKVLHGRQGDNWRVLIAIADSFGAPWGKMAREAAVAFAAGSGDEDSLILLLYDIRTIFRAGNLDRIKSAVLIRELIDMEDGVGLWGAWRGENDDQSPHEITQAEVASLLRRLDGLRPQTVFERGSRQSRGPSGRGYYRKQFELWWRIYCRDDDEPANSDMVRRLHPKA
jgi:hypothetical protein